jgi:hypothetical protein
MVTINTSIYIKNSKGERAEYGDIIKLELYDYTGFDATQEYSITGIYTDGMILLNSYTQVHVNNIKDFKIIKSY